MQPNTAATDATPTQAPEPAPAAPTAEQAPAEAATAEQAGDPTLGVDVAFPEDLPTFDNPTADEVDAGIAEWEASQADADELADEHEPSPLAAACAAGTVKLYRLRASGTTRRLPWLSGEALETAEWYWLRVDQGASVRQVAEECETSKATVRRALTILALMEEITDGLHDDALEADVTEVVFAFGDEDGESE